VLKGAAVVGAATTLPLTAQAMGSRRLVIFDSRVPESLAFARTTPAAYSIDLVEARATRFAALRQGLPTGLTVEALTRRSDMVDLRHELARQGLRLSGIPRYGALVRWSMKPR
jgi:hypothetical protein